MYGFGPVKIRCKYTKSKSVFKKGQPYLKKSFAKWQSSQNTLCDFELKKMLVRLQENYQIFYKNGNVLELYNMWIIIQSLFGKWTEIKSDS